MTSYVEYALQVRKDGLQIFLDSSRLKREASPRIGNGARFDMVPIDSRKLNILDHHSVEPKLLGWSNKSVYVTPEDRTTFGVCKGS